MIDDLKLHPSDIKILCPNCQKRKERGKWHFPIRCPDCRRINARIKNRKGL
jgi:Zn finger protein HypA/HybF involved in hydrogenase expression